MTRIPELEKCIEQYNRTLRNVTVRVADDIVGQFSLLTDKIVISRFTYKKKEDPHTHDFVEICYVENGRVEQVVNGVKAYMERGQMLIFLPGDKHEFTPVGEATIANIMFSPEVLGSCGLMESNAPDLLSYAACSGDKSGKDKPNIISFTGLGMVNIEQIINNMADEFNTKRSDYELVLKSYLDIVLVSALRQMKNGEAGGGEVANISKITPEVIAYIEKNYNKKLTLSEVAKISFYNPRYFCSLFKECFGKTLTEYLNELRVKKAIELLGETSLPVDEICYMVGFGDKKFFYRLFKKITGTTPALFRKNQKQTIIVLDH